MFSFISPNKWFRANYGTNIRRYLATTCRIRSITDFGELSVFKSAATFPMIFVAQKVSQKATQSPTFTQVKSLDPPYPEIREIIEMSGSTLPSTAITDSTWTLASSRTASIIDQMKHKGLSLREFVQGRIFYGVKTGFNDAFVIDSETRKSLVREDPLCKSIIKPLAVGDDIRRWKIRDHGQWLIFTRRGVDINRYPAIKRHLSQWRQRLEPKPSSWPSGKKWDGRKPGSYKWYEIQDEVAYHEFFTQKKIVYPVICKEPRFSYDHHGYFTNDKAFMIPTDDLFLVGVLNSRPIWEFLKRVCSALGDADNGGRLELRSIYMSGVPIPDAGAKERKRIIELTSRCLDREGENCTDEEADLDTLVADL